MRGKYYQEYLVLVGVLNKLRGNVASMAVKYQKTILSLCCGLGSAIKHLFKLGKSHLIVAPACTG